MTTPETASGRGYITAGLISLLFFVGGALVWALTAPLAGAVVVSGRLSVQDDNQPIQAPIGGTVAAVLVQEGAPIARGSPVITLEGQAIRRELAILRQQLSELRLRRHRLQAQLDNDAALDSTSLPEPTEALHQSFDREARALATYRAQIHSEQTHQDSQQRSADDELAGLRAQRQALRAQLALLDAEYSEQTELVRRGLSPNAALRRSETARATTTAQIHALDAHIASVQTRISQMAFERAQTALRRESAILDELGQIEGRFHQLLLQETELEQHVNRLTIHAPIGGRVLDLRVSGPGSVVQPAQELMRIVPQYQPLVIRARIPVRGADSVQIGQPAKVHLPTLSTSLAHPLDAEIVSLSPDIVTDDWDHSQFYKAELIFTHPESWPTTLDLRPGLPVEAHLALPARTFWQYITQPISRFMARAAAEG